jgi:hypothetical protein
MALQLKRRDKTYYPVGRAAKMLGTNTAKVKELMVNGDLEWSNLQVNGPLYIPQDSILAYQRRLLELKRAHRHTK